MSIRGRSFSFAPNDQWMTAEAKSMFSLLRDEYEGTKNMPILKRYKEMERIIEIFTAEDVLHKLLVLTREVDEDGVMLASGSVEARSINGNSNTANDCHCPCTNTSPEETRKTFKMAKSFSLPTNSNLNRVQSPIFPESNANEVSIERRNSDQSSNTCSSHRRQRNGILQNIIKSDEIPEFQIPPQLTRRPCRQNVERRCTEPNAAASSPNTTSSSTVSHETNKVDRQSLSSTGYLRDSAALPGFFINTGFSLESLNIQTLCSHMTGNLIVEYNVPRIRRNSAISICQEKHLQDLDLASLNSFHSVDKVKSPEPGTLLRLFIYEQILSLRKEYSKLKGKNVLVRYRKMTDMLENCSRSCGQLKM